MKWIFADNMNEIGHIAAEQVRQLLKKKPDAVLGFATGSSMMTTLEELVRLYAKGRLDFSSAITFNVDEYLPMAPDDPTGYAYYMHQKLFSKVNFKPERIHLLDGLSAKPEEEIQRYEKAIDEAGGMDLLLLGLGRNGHIAFNEPADYFHYEGHVVELAVETWRDNHRLAREGIPHQAMTLGMGRIMQAKRILLISNNDIKRQILHQAVTGPVTPQIPVSLLRFHQDVTILQNTQE